MGEIIITKVWVLLAAMLILFTSCAKRPVNEQNTPASVPARLQSENGTGIMQHPVADTDRPAPAGEESAWQDKKEIATEAPDEMKLFFFPNPDKQVRYQALYQSTLPGDAADTANYVEKQVVLDVQEIAGYDHGTLYLLQLQDVPDASILQYAVPLLGYFYVSADRIWLINATEDDAPSLLSENDLLAVGTLVASQENVDDILGIDEKGYHEYIIMDGRQCRYTAYNSMVGTGFYQTVIWEENKGLVEYWCGFGSMRDHFEIKIVE